MSSDDSSNLMLALDVISEDYSVDITCYMKLYNNSMLRCHLRTISN